MYLGQFTGAMRFVAIWGIVNQVAEYCSVGFVEEESGGDTIGLLSIESPRFRRRGRRRHDALGPPLPKCSGTIRYR
jgi:hypothetical protein